MEILAGIRFSCQEKDIDAWEGLLAGLCDEKRGAWLEVQFEQFGEAAGEAISDLLDDCEKRNEYVVFESYSRDGNRFETCLNGGWGIFECLPRIRGLLLLAGVQKLEIDEPDHEQEY